MSETSSLTKLQTHPVPEAFEGGGDLGDDVSDFLSQARSKRFDVAKDQKE